MSFPTEPVNSYPHLVLMQSIRELLAASNQVSKTFNFSPYPDNQLAANVSHFIETGSESALEQVVLYLAHLRGKREGEQVAAEEAVISQQREDKMREDAEEDRHIMFLRDNHSVAALH